MYWTFHAFSLFVAGAVLGDLGSSVFCRKSLTNVHILLVFSIPGLRWISVVVFSLVSQLRWISLLCVASHGTREQSARIRLIVFCIAQLGWITMSLIIVFCMPGCAGLESLIKFCIAGLHCISASLLCLA